MIVVVSRDTAGRYRTLSADWGWLTCVNLRYGSFLEAKYLYICMYMRDWSNMGSSRHPFTSGHECFQHTAYEARMGTHDFATPPDLKSATRSRQKDIIFCRVRQRCFSSFRRFLTKFVAGASLCPEQPPKETTHWMHKVFKFRLTRTSVVIV